MESTSFEVVREYLPKHIRDAMNRLTCSERQRLNEVRLYNGRFVVLVYPDMTEYLTDSGCSKNADNSAISVTEADISSIVDRLAHFSIHSCDRELRQGCFVLKNGVRVGLSGIYSGDGILTSVCGISFRISRNINGCATELFDLLMRENCSLLICGSVNSGKTTILRDLCRLIGNKRKVTILDERGEIASLQRGTPMNDVGRMTDVISGCSRKKGIESAVRTLSPDYIMCDELVSEDDTDVILSAVGCGVNFCATAHGEIVEDVMKRRCIADLIKRGVFRYIAILRGKSAPGVIGEIRRIGDD